MRFPQVCMALVLASRGAMAQEPETPAQPEAGRIEETIVVTASRSEQPVQDAPAAVTVITSSDLEERPGDGYADILRNVPGLNVTQIGAREVQVTARAATNSLATSQLVMLDGRPLYLDFFGFVMWDFLPVHVSEIKQVEVVRGPGSAMWGANAMTGVINMITKRPDEMKGTSVVLGGGEGGTILGSVVHAGTHERPSGGLGHEAWGYKLSASFHEQGPFDRPTGFIPGTRTPYPPFENEGTRQAKADLRLDWTMCFVVECGNASLSGGHAQTDGLVHTGIGPFDLRKGAAMTYAKADFSSVGALHVSAFANLLDADSTNLLAVGADGRPLPFSFRTSSYGLDVSKTSWPRRKHLLTYGVSARHNEFDLSIAPDADRRDEAGAFLQDELTFGRTRWVAGARVDHRDPIGTVASPRAALLYSPTPNHTLRVSFGRAYRAPSLINNDLETGILSSIPLPGGPFVFATRATGNRRLREERMDAWELGYTGSVPGRLSVSVSLYRNRSSDFIDFYPSAFYTSSNPPAGWPLPPHLLDSPPLRNALPSDYSYRNVGEIVNEGVELALSGRVAARGSWFANYSYQANPRVNGIPAGEINVPPAHRANVGGSWNRGAFFLNASVNYQSQAIWRDILDARYWGPTDGFASWNAAAGVRLSQKVTVSLTGTNLTDERIQQHVFGDIISRRVTAQVRFVDP